MAKIVFGAGASHSPLLTIPVSDWSKRAEADYANKRLNLSDGRYVTYQELAASNGEPHAGNASIGEFERQEKAANAALDRMADDLAAADPDVVIIVGDDQEELFGTTNQPAFCVYYGEEVVMNDKYGRETNPDWVRTMSKGYMMDTTHRHPGAPKMALDLIGGLLDRGVDVSTSSHVEDPKLLGFGHAIGFIIERLFRGRKYPVLPLLLNTYFPPNVIRPGRCYDIGQMVRAVLEEMAGQERVAVIASGGLSHFVTDADLDLRILEGFEPGKAHLLRSLPMGALNSGSSEILNWIMTAGAVEHLPLGWKVYEPVYRTPAGTGIGLGFGVWK